jgi:DNA-binding Lrp family transcriptional regulator
MPADRNKDRALLALLAENARMPVAELARRLGVSRTSVQSRISRLEREGQIGGYTILPGAASGAVDTIHAVVMVELDLKRQAGVIERLRKVPGIVACHTVSGQFDLLLTIKSETPAALDIALDQIAGLDGVKKTTSSVLLARKFGTSN